MPASERVSGILLSVLPMDKSLLGHGQKVSRHFVESFTGLLSGGKEGFPAWDLKLGTGLQCWSTHAM